MKRRRFMEILGISSVATPSSWNMLASSKNTMPVLFIGHGAPLYTLDENPYTLAW